MASKHPWKIRYTKRIPHSMDLRYISINAIGRSNIHKYSRSLTRILRRRVIVHAFRHNFRIAFPSRPPNFDRRSGVRSIQTLLPKIPYRDTTFKIIPAHVANVNGAYFDPLTSRLTVSPRPSMRFAERHILIVLSTAQKTAFPLRYTLPGTPSTPNLQVVAAETAV